MKQYLFLILALLLSNFMLSQQWVSPIFNYDSVYDVTYGTAINFNNEVDTLKMDIYSPLCNTSSNPLILVIHGGGFIAGDKNETNITKICKNYAKRGYVAASINYRLGYVSDDTARSCNYPNYPCLFATDKAEWYRAYYRAIQDAKGALRFLINRNSQYNIDTNNVFLTGESAGAFISLGVALLDTNSERFIETYALDSVKSTHTNASNCPFNVNETFNAYIQRPDLGSIEGNIEPTTINYSIKGIGNFYGGMFSNLLKESKANKPKPAIYSFHQPCDLIVPIDSNKVYWGLTWCFTNGYNCFGIANNPMIYGSRTFSNWNTNNSYGYTIQNEFTTTNFPYSFSFVPASCTDQVNNPCHGYDNFTVRENNLAIFFSNLVTSTYCDTNSLSIGKVNEEIVKVYPNPFKDEITIESNKENSMYVITDITGNEISKGKINKGKNTINSENLLSNGVYFISIYSDKKTTYKIIKQ